VIPVLRMTDRVTGEMKHRPAKKRR